MGNYNVGDMIRLSRIAKKMTQEELSEGVCSVETLSRIENGSDHRKKLCSVCQQGYGTDTGKRIF